MATMIVGLFTTPSDYKKIEQELEAVGFGNDEYIVFVVQNSAGNDFMLTVKVANSQQKENAIAVFNSNNVQNTYDFYNMSWEDATYATFKREIKERAKYEVKEIPNLHVKDPSHGMDDRIKS